MSRPGFDHPIKKYVVKGIAGGIGLASEGISAYKSRKKSSSGNVANDKDDVENETLPGAEKTPAAVEPVELPADSPADSEEAIWELDAAQDELFHISLEQQKETTPAKQRNFEDLKSFLAQYPAPPPGQVVSRLPMPVILPQRRPKARTRGFVRAYAPVLNDCAISQDMFLDFLETFYLSTQASPWIAAVNLAGLGLSFVPHMSMLVGIAIQAGVLIAEDVQNRTRTNSFLDQANAEVFRPRGLFCLVMTFDPDAAEKDQGVQLNSTIANRMNPSGFGKVGHHLKESSGTTISEMDFPEAAPLIFPGLNEADEQQSQEAVSKKEKMIRKKKYVSDYYDKRARAGFAGKNPDSVLAQGPQPTFKSRYADPNHPASSGSFRSLITGGHVNPPSMTRPSQGLLGLMEQGGFRGRQGLGSRSSGSRREQMLGGLGGFFSNPPAPYGESSSSNSEPLQSALSQRRDGIGLLGLPTAGSMIKKAVKKNVLYFMIVNMPSDEELAEAMAEIDARRKQGFSLPGILSRL